jgi:hypothetical protein
LEYKVYSVDQLIRQVATNPVVRKRFARHFQIPESRVVSYMRANLVESYIPKTGRYTVYCVHRSGKFYPVHQTFHRGTKVFALRNGDPVMKWVCGNPLSHFLPSVHVVVSEAPPAPPAKTKVAAYHDQLPADTVETLLPSEVNTPAYQPMVPVHLASASTAVFSHGSANLLPLLLPVALIGVHSGGGSNGVPVAAVPEAAPLAMIAAGLPFLLIGMKRRKDRTEKA